eukprot:TRINITY_DN10284_c0_g2_i1.p2 TRINITY_DN10284_c0_g2~~TRINITY_DN10284_c0_g2_i1.p2  ORF type:complete len:818 (+),score=238.26 TRINITY_DN10284_c0_g2_i1:2873-5326(+)
MREIGADPLEAFGGIFGIKRGDQTRYPTELATDGSVGWTKTTMDPKTMKVTIDDNAIYAKNFLQPPYGWSILQWQGWAIGDFTVQSEGTYLLQCVNTQQVYVDSRNNYMRGDWYGYGYLYQPIHLTSGRHTLYVKTQSSVREFGNTAVISFQCKFLNADSPLQVPSGSTPILPSIVDGKPSSRWISVAMANTGLDWIRNVRVDQVGMTPIDLAPGQSSFLNFEAKFPGDSISCPFNLTFCILGELNGKLLPCLEYSVQFSCSFLRNSSYIFTFPDYDGSVQYAVVIPPTQGCSSGIGNKCSVMLATHGAGVDTSNPFWAGAFDREPHSWIVLPTGRNPWGFDWHGPSAKSAFAALEYLRDNLPGIPASQISDFQVDLSRVLYTGHSMGGAGCWYLSSHFSDKALAAACVAGFISIEKYVPFYLHLGTSHADPILRGILESSIVEYDSDLYAGNLVGIPVMARYGSDDHNVPPWNSRRNSRVIDELSRNVTSVIVSEAPGEPHWWDSAMNAPIIKNFYQNYLVNTLPNFPREFVAVSSNPGTCGSRGSVKIVQVEIPGRLARVHVVQEGSTWKLKTENTRRFGFEQDSRGPKKSVVIDDQILPLVNLPDSHYCKVELKWEICRSWEQGERRIEQLGPAFHVMSDKFAIVYGSLRDREIYLKSAVDLANAWFLYANGNVSVISDEEYLQNFQDWNGNIILMGDPSSNSASAKLSGEFPVKFDQDGRSFRIDRKFYNASRDLGLLFVGKLGPTTTLLSLSGTTPENFELARMSVPIFSGMEVPDFMVMTPEMKWKGAGGILAAGYWDHKWQLSRESSYLR